MKKEKAFYEEYNGRTCLIESRPRTGMSLWAAHQAYWIKKYMGKKVILSTLEMPAEKIIFSRLDEIGKV
jgi:hypothetical protein